MSNVISIEVLAETKKLRQGMDQSVASLGKLNKSAKSLGPTLKGFLAADIITKGAGAIKDFIGGAIDEAREAQKVGAQTNAVIKSTGGAAKVTADHIGDYANKLSVLSGIDDETIQSGQNMLLTFTNIRNEAGKGNDIFDQATKSALDYSVATGTDLTKANIQLGKALNDPIKGMTALSKNGVAFTAQQKDQIKALVKNGDLLGAQKIILAEVNKEFGGSAEAQATAADKAKVAWGNFKEAIGTQLLPVLDLVLNAVARLLPQAVEVGGQVFQKLSPIFTAVGSALKPIIDGIGKLGTSGETLSTFAGYFGAVKTVVMALLPVLGSIFSTLVGAVQQSLPTIKAGVGDVISIFKSIAEIVTNVWKAIGPNVLPIVKSVFTTLISVIGGALKIIAGVFKVISAVLKGDWSGAWNGIKQIAAGVVQIVVALVKNFGVQMRVIIDQLAKTWGSIWTGIKNRVQSLVSGMVSAVVSKVSSLRASAINAFNAMKNSVVSIITGLVSSVQSKINAVISAVNSIRSRILSALSGAGSWLSSAGYNVVAGFVGGIQNALGWVADTARSIASTAINAAQAALGIASPSKVFKQIGAYVGQGFVIGLNGTESQINSAVKKMTSLVISAYAKREISHKQMAKAVSLLVSGQTKAIATERKLVGITNKLADAQKNLADRIKQRNDAAVSIRNNSVSFASIVGIKNENDLPLTSNDLVQGLKERLAAIKNYQTKLQALVKLGLNKVTLDQLIDAGVEGGTQAVDALFAGGKGAVAQVNDLTSQIVSSSNALGNQAADAMYKTGIQAQQGLVNGLLADQKALQAAAKKIADTLTKEIKKVLKIKSPSRVFMEIGDYVVQGLNKGLDENAVKAQARTLSTSLVRGFGTPTLDTSTSVGTRYGSNTYQITVNVPLGTSKADVGREVVTAIKEYEKTSGRRVLTQ